MKRLTCEMCGSTDFLKQEGVFVCQSCGCKYSVEEAKKMMIEGTVDVSGSTVKVDNSSFVENYLANARRAKEKTDWEEVEKYYNLVEQNDPTNIEAIFYSAYGKAMQSLSDADYYKKKAVFEIFFKSLSIIDDYYDPAQRETLQPLIETMGRDLIKLTDAEFIYHPQRTVKIEGQDFYERTAIEFLVKRGQLQFIETLENIIKKDEKPYLYKILITFYGHAINYDYFPIVAPTNKHEALRDDYRERFTKANARLKELDSTYTPKTLPEKPQQSGGCYVATAVYGSYDCAQVWTLRRFRDYTLAETWYGRAFIRTYYAISPTLVRWFGNTEWFKKLWKNPLDRMVARLNAEGVEDTPYEDRNW